ncbi:MAG TPA: hypothetical protein VJS69_04060 [Candidatus Krumholzibacteria bacterium]|nr:hypothetical protein [Candidatus Krumholzibacteria bacterium]
MIVGVASGLSVESLKPWCASARNVYRGPMLLLTDTPAKYQELTETYGIEMWFAPLRSDTEGVCGIARTRWKGLADALTDIEPQLPVVFADTRDVVFQSDPCALIDTTLVIGTEGKRHEENAWCMMWLQQLYPNECQQLAPLEVLNAGVIGGSAGLLRKFALAVYSELPTIPCDCTAGAMHMTDQTAVNHLVRNGYGTQVQIRSDWVFHVRSMDHGRIPAVFHEDSKQLIRADGEPFPIVHQYDLAPQLSPLAEIR